MVNIAGNSVVWIGRLFVSDSDSVVGETRVLLNGTGCLVGPAECATRAHPAARNLWT